MTTKVACVGVGTVGRSWALRFAGAGCRVALYDSSDAALEKAMALIERGLADLQEWGLIEDSQSARQRIRLTNDLSEALQGCDYVQESVPENVQLKRDIFTEMDKRAPAATVLASSTSEIRGSEFLESVPGRARALIAHPLNPPHLIPLVELCPSPWTSHETVKAAQELLIGVGQKPILVRKEIRGFIANRLQLALLGEALHLVGEGFCSPEDIDVAMTDGLARRWAFIGPLETGHLNASGGYADYIRLYGETHRKILDDLKVAYEWSDDLIATVDASMRNKAPHLSIEEQQTSRDRRLIALARHLDNDTGDEVQ